MQRESDPIESLRKTASKSVPLTKHEQDLWLPEECVGDTTVIVNVAKIKTYGWLKRVLDGAQDDIAIICKITTANSPVLVYDEYRVSEDDVLYSSYDYTRSGDVDIADAITYYEKDRSCTDNEIIALDARLQSAEPLRSL